MANEPYSLGNVNVDSVKELLLFLSQSYPFTDESGKEAFIAQVNGIDQGSNPHEAEAASLNVPAPVAPAAEAETPAEDTTEGTEETIPVETPTGETTAAPATVATAEGSAPAATSELPAATIPSAEGTAEERVAALKAQLAQAEAEAAGNQGS